MRGENQESRPGAEDRTTAKTGRGSSASHRRAVDEAAARLARRQASIVTRRQAAALGMSPEAIRARLSSGRWRLLHRGVYATFTGTPSRAALLWAALLASGPGAALSHHTAAELYGLATQPAPVLHVSVPDNRRVTRCAGVVVHHDPRLPAARHPSRRPPCTRLDDTVVDLATAARSTEDAFGWVCRAIGGRLTTPARLQCALSRRPRARWRRELRAALDDVAAGCHSPLELRYLRTVERAHRLPEGLRQAADDRHGARRYADVWYQPFATVVELNGAVAHPVDLRGRDLRRDNASAALGDTVPRYGYGDVADRACAVAAQVAAVLRLHGWTGVAVPCRPGCAVGGAGHVR